MNNKSWMNLFDERQQKEIGFSRVYADQYAHGTDGHNAKLIIAKMAKVLEEVEFEVKRTTPESSLALRIAAILGIE